MADRLGLVVWFAIASAGFRKMLTVLTGIAILGLIALAVWLQIDQNAREKEEQAAKLRIPRERVELIDMRMGLDGPSVKLAGRVRNGDQAFTLTSIELRLRIEECAAPDRCDTVGDTTETVSVNVPPQQVRDIDTYVYFRGLGATRAGRTWKSDVVSVRGR